jgi:hypothetical protein
MAIPAGTSKASKLGIRRTSGILRTIILLFGFVLVLLGVFAIYESPQLSNCRFPSYCGKLNGTTTITCTMNCPAEPSSSFIFLRFFGYVSMGFGLTIGAFGLILKSRSKPVRYMKMPRLNQTGKGQAKTRESCDFFSETEITHTPALRTNNKINGREKIENCFPVGFSAIIGE